jgi:hypothetical protein
MNIRPPPSRLEITWATNQLGGLALKPDRFIIEKHNGANSSVAPSAAESCPEAEPGAGKSFHNNIMVAAMTVVVTINIMFRLEISGRYF